jgi:hypothetical protein
MRCDSPRKRQIFVVPARPRQTVSASRRVGAGREVDESARNFSMILMERPLGGRDRRRGSGRFRGWVILNRWPSARGDFDRLREHLKSRSTIVNFANDARQKGKAPPGGRRGFESLAGFWGLGA